MYGYSRTTDLSYSEALEKTRAELQKEGFGVLTEIDVQKTLKMKIDADIEAYTILGACNPPSAFKAISAEKEIGLMLPCNLIVYAQDGKTHISAILPKSAMGMIENPVLAEVAEHIEKKLISVIDRVE